MPVPEVDVRFETELDDALSRVFIGKIDSVRFSLVLEVYWQQLRYAQPRCRRHIQRK